MAASTKNKTQALLRQIAQALRADDAEAFRRLTQDQGVLCRMMYADFNENFPRLSTPTRQVVLDILRNDHNFEQRAALMAAAASGKTADVMPWLVENLGSLFPDGMSLDQKEKEFKTIDAFARATIHPASRLTGNAPMLRFVLASKELRPLLAYSSLKSTYRNGAALHMIKRMLTAAHAKDWTLLQDVMDVVLSNPFHLANRYPMAELRRLMTSNLGALLATVPEGQDIPEPLQIQLTRFLDHQQEHTSASVIRPERWDALAPMTASGSATTGRWDVCETTQAPIRTVTDLAVLSASPILTTLMVSDREGVLAALTQPWGITALTKHANTSTLQAVMRHFAPELARWRDPNGFNALHYLYMARSESKSRSMHRLLLGKYAECLTAQAGPLQVSPLAIMTAEHRAILEQGALAKHIQAKPNPAIRQHAL